jgi:hypothetical protein
MRPYIETLGTQAPINTPVQCPWEARLTELLPPRVKTLFTLFSFLHWINLPRRASSNSILCPRILGPCWEWHGPHTKRSRTHPGGPVCSRGGPGPCPEVWSVYARVRHFPMKVRTHRWYLGGYCLLWPCGGPRAVYVVGLGVVLHAARDSRAGTASLYYSKRYPCFRVPKKPEGEEFSLYGPWCTGHCPVAHRTVRCARPGFSLVSFAPLFWTLT